MKDSPKSTDLYALACNEFSFLEAFGYQVVVGQDKTEFVSRIYKFVIWRDRYGEPPTYTLYAATTSKELPSPVTALQYYLDDYLQEWATQEAAYSELPQTSRAIKTLAALLKKNSWIFTAGEWVDDEKFVHAVEETNSWFQKKLSEGVLPSHSESVTHLHAWRP